MELLESYIRSRRSVNLTRWIEVRTGVSLELRIEEYAGCVARFCILDEAETRSESRIIEEVSAAYASGDHWAGSLRVAEVADVIPLLAEFEFCSVISNWRSLLTRKDRVRIGGLSQSQFALLPRLAQRKFVSHLSNFKVGGGVVVTNSIENLLGLAKGRSTQFYSTPKGYAVSR